MELGEPRLDVVMARSRQICDGFLLRQSAPLLLHTPELRRLSTTTNCTQWKQSNASSRLPDSLSPVPPMTPTSLATKVCSEPTMRVKHADRFHSPCLVFPALPAGHSVEPSLSDHSAVVFAFPRYSRLAEASAVPVADLAISGDSACSNPSSAPGGSLGRNPRCLVAARDL